MPEVRRSEGDLVLYIPVLRTPAGSKWHLYDIQHPAPGNHTEEHEDRCFLSQPHVLKACNFMTRYTGLQ